MGRDGLQMVVWRCSAPFLPPTSPTRTAPLGTKTEGREWMECSSDCSGWELPWWHGCALPLLPRDAGADGAARAGGRCVRVARGAELGVVVACCQDDSTCCVLVQKPIFLSSDSQHCSRWSTAARPHHEFWQLHEVIPCVAWKVEGGEITTIMM